LGHTGASQAERSPHFLSQSG